MPVGRRAIIIFKNLLATRIGPNPPRYGPIPAVLVLAVHVTEYLVPGTSVYSKIRSLGARCICFWYERRTKGHLTCLRRTSYNSGLWEALRFESEACEENPLVAYELVLKAAYEAREKQIRGFKGLT
jgi:hypothetical protein